MKRAVARRHRPDPKGRQRRRRTPSGFHVWTLRLGALAARRWSRCSVLLVVLYGPMVGAAARVPGLERELARLEAENARVRELSAALDSAESRYAQVRQMMGGDIVRDPLTITSSLPVAPAIRARLASEPRPSVPGSVPRSTGRWTSRVTSPGVRCRRSAAATRPTQGSTSRSRSGAWSGPPAVPLCGQPARTRSMASSSCLTMRTATRPCTDTFRAS